MKNLTGAIFLFFIAAFSTQVLADEKIQIGVSTALTGNAAPYGTDMKNVFLYANHVLANDKYEFIFDDDKCSGKDAVTVAQRFINILRLNYAAGFACSSTAISTAKLYEKSKTLVMITSASAPSISQMGDYIFRTWPSDASFGKKLFEYMNKKGYKKVGILSEQTDYAQGLQKAFIDADTHHEMKIVSEDFLTDTSDFRTPLLKLKAAQVDTVFLNPQSEVTLLASLKQYRELGLKAPVITSLFNGSPILYEKHKELAEGIVYADALSPEEAITPENRHLYENYVKQYGELNSVKVMFLTTFEGVRALHAAISSGQDLREYLYKTTFHGIFGDWHFDQNGDIQGLDPVMKTVRNGHPERIND